MSEAAHLVSLEGAVLEHLSGGVVVPLASGTVVLSIFSVPALPPPSYTTGFKDHIPPPLPPRSPVVGDQWLILTLLDHGAPLGSDPLFELPIPSTARVVTLPPYSYIIPCPTSSFELFKGPVAAGKRRENDDEAGGFIKVTLSNDVDPDERDLFESTLWGWTSASFTPEADSRSIKGPHDLRSRLVLIDEQNGHVLGELETGSTISEEASLGLENQGENEKEPVVVDFEQSQPGKPAGLVTVHRVSSWQPTYNPTNSSLITMADYVSQGIVVGAEALGRGMEWGAEKFTQNVKPAESPLVFSARTRANIEGGHKVTAGAVKVSSKTVGVISELASNLGDRVGRKLGIQSTLSGKPPTGIKGLANRSLVAFNTVIDSLETGGKTLLVAGSSSSTKAIDHRWGAEAGQLSAKMGGSVKHVALVYIDARGVTRRALLRSVGKSALRAKMTDGSEVVLAQNSLSEFYGGVDLEEKQSVGKLE